MSECVRTCIRSCVHISACVSMHKCNLGQVLWKAISFVFIGVWSVQSCSFHFNIVTLLYCMQDDCCNPLPYSNPTLSDLHYYGNKNCIFNLSTLQSAPSSTLFPQMWVWTEVYRTTTPDLNIMVTSKISLTNSQVPTLTIVTKTPDSHGVCLPWHSQTSENPLDPPQISVLTGLWSDDTLVRLSVISV